MPTELEELVEFLHHGNTQIRQIACENLVGYSTDSLLFKNPDFVPIKDLKLLVRDYSSIAKNALVILVNLSQDEEILDNLAQDDEFLESLLKRITDVKEPNANEIAMLLSNLAKSDSLARITGLKRSLPTAEFKSAFALNQLMDCFVRGAEGKLNPKATYDYLAYFFADISRHKTARQYFVTKQEYDNVVPVTKLTVFTEHKSYIRRKGVASTIKNVAFEVDSHDMLMDENGANLLPYILLPLTGSEEYPEDEMTEMLPDLQLLPPDKTRDNDHKILVTHLETLLLLTTKRQGREVMRKVRVYPIIRECHMHVENEDVREACDRLVQVIMRDEEGEAKTEELDDDERVEEVF